ncbi:MAG: lamin tail domain-containing protein, partial [Pirellulales bacterium]
AGLRYLGEDPAPYASYLKGTNGSERDWSDVIRLTDVLNRAPDATYIEQLEEVVNVDQWLRTIAMVVLTGDMEAGLLTGDAGGDDYAMYRGIEDSRFLMVPYDLDSMFQGPAGSLFRTDTVPALQRMLNHPQIVPRYYAQIIDLIDNVLTEEKVRPILEPLLVLESEARVNSIFTFLQRARDFVRARIPTELTASSDLPVSGGLPRTSEATSGTLSGSANALTTRSVQVAGSETTWDARGGTWSIADVPLLPGVNRVLVQTFGEDGQEVDRTFIDIWRDTGVTQDITESITTDTVWTAEAGPYRVMGEVTVAENATLTIAPGTSIYFDAGARLTIRGRLLAEGTDQSRIRFTRVPGTNTQWSGVQFFNTVADNRIRYAVLEYGVTDEGMIGLVNSRAELDQLAFDHSDRRRIRAVNASMTLRNSTFTDMFGPDQPPTSNNQSEQINGSGILEGGEMVIEGNTFGTTKGHNDVIDFNSPRRPDPILQILGNTFAGSGDEILDLGGDAYIEGNLFQNVHKDEFNQGTGDANAISTGDAGVNTTITVVRNVFRDVDHAVNLKRGTFMFFENNTVIGIPDDTDEASFSVINFLIPQRDPPGKGATLNGNIFQDIPQRIFGHVDEGLGTRSTELEMHNTLVPPERAADVVGERPGTILDLGTGNLAADPRLIDPAGDVRLRPGSPAIGRGPNGIDLGAAVASGASISGEPAPRTAQTSATLNVAGPGITHYRYRLSDGPWSPATPVDVPIELVDLQDGTVQVTVIGQYFSGVWQEEATAAVSRAWTVDPAFSLLQISEILASNRAAVEQAGTFPDLVELANRGGSPIDLSGISMTDDPADPDKFVFPDGTSIDPGQRLVLSADRQFGAPGIHLGFSLNSEGEGLFLYDRSEDGGGLLDSIQFGIQVPDLSLGRGDDGQWVLSQPTFGAPNLAVQLGDPTTLRINEWLADADNVLPNEFIEIYNTDPLPVDLSGMFLTDHPVGWSDRFQIAPYSYIAGSGFAVFDSDSELAAGSNHVNFRLARQRGAIGLFDTNLELIDQARYSQQFSDASQGMVPDGGLTVTSFPLPSPGLSNTDETFLPLWDGLRITEIMYHPMGGSDFEFIELQNSGEETVRLAGVRLTKGVDFTFPDIELAPDELIVVVNNRSAFESRYGTGIRIAGQFSGKLSNGGERIRLQLPDPHPGNIQNFRYDDAWYPRTDGTGFSLVPSGPLGVPTDWSLASAWRASSFVNGSPGAADSSLDAGAIVINEVLTNTDDAAGARIELLNRSDTTLDISGWYLSDDPNDLAKYQIPDGAVIQAGGFLLLSEQAGFGSALVVDPHGGQIWLASPDAVGSVAGIAEGVSTTAVDAEVTLGRYVRSDGSAVFVEQRANTLGAENAGPAVGPVVIDEIMVQPAEADDEFIELSNISDQAVSLYDTANPNNTWQLTGTVEYVFPPGVEIVPGGLLLITGIDPATFRARYAIGDDVPMLGPFTGTLDDEGGDVRIVRPGVPDGLFVPGILVDRVQYDNDAPWPAEAAGDNSSLNRLQLDAYGDDVVNWEASLAFGTPGLPNLPLDRTPGSAPQGLTTSAATGPAIALAWQASVDPESGIDGYRVYRDGLLIATATTTQYDDFDVEVLTPYTYEIAAVNGQGLESAKGEAAVIFLMSIESITARF